MIFDDMRSASWFGERQRTLRRFPCRARVDDVEPMLNGGDRQLLGFQEAHNPEFEN
jgi:hypothetical protein